MAKPTTTISLSDIILDEEIYPRERIDQKRVGIFAENIRDGFTFDPIEVQAHPKKAGKYRILDGAHRWGAYKATGVKDPEVIIKNLDGVDPLLYAAKKAIGPRQLREEETRNTARRAFQNNPRLTSSEIGGAIGRSRQTVDSYIADLRAVIRMDLDLKIFRMRLLGIPQERIATRLGIPRTTLETYLTKMPELANSSKADLSRGFTVSQVAEKHGWPEPLVWAVALEGKDDLARFKELNWGLRTWDLWEWNNCDKRFGDDWPGRIPAQLIAHILYYFSTQNDLIFDPMSGGGVAADTALALGRRCWSLDMIDRPDTRPEIEPYYWEMMDNSKLEGKGQINAAFLTSREKPDLIIFDPPYFDKKACDYPQKSISMLSRKEYLKFFEDFFSLMRQHTKKTTKLAFINADWRNFQNRPASDEDTEESILIDDYLRILNISGWQRTHIIQAPMSAERFNAGVVSAMQKGRILGVCSRYVIILKTA
jgi:DNA modification methylase/DNA-binding CsgD family transcriptional regulator